MALSMAGLLRSSCRAPAAARTSPLFALPMRAISSVRKIIHPVICRFAVPLRAKAPRTHWMRKNAATGPFPPSHPLVLLALPRRAFSAAATVVAEDTAGSGSGSGSSSSSRRAMGYWLAGTAGMVFVMVVLGGVTRLTRSGLSIVDWRAAGEKYPADEAAWEREFDKYKAFPEYQRVNRGMTLAEFKPIWFMEWAHRMWGRAIGLAFTLPLAYFVVARKVPHGFGARLGGLLAIGATQGGVGWWMVKSGLEHDRFGENSVPRVSPYRLATHLGFAWTVYSLLLWNAWDLLKRPLAVTAAQHSAALRARPWVAGATALIGTTVASGAFVAGNDAGHAYNDWPLFAGRVIPEQIWDDRLGVRNFFENTATVQFDHRTLAYLSLLGVGTVHMALKRASGGVRESIHPGLRRPAVLLGALVGGQALLGITTLLFYVPVWMGAAHQAGALALWTGALYTLHAASAVAGGGETGAAAAVRRGMGAAGKAVAGTGGKAAVAGTAVAMVVVGRRGGSKDE